MTEREPSAALVALLRGDDAAFREHMGDLADVEPMAWSPPPEKQSRVDSFMEAVTNTAVGFIVTLAASPLIYAMTGVSITLHQMAGATLLFTVVSVARQYVLRRLFNGRSVWSAIRGR